MWISGGKGLWLAIGAAAVLAGSGCGLSSGGGGAASKVEVVAAENFWGSIASQVGGDRVHVSSIVSNPGTDPHAYEATPGDARTIARARYVIVNGAGYDPWVPKLISANPVSDRQVMTVADLFGKKEGDNPHLWYAPAYVDQVVDRIAVDLARISPGDAAYFQQQGAAYRSTGLQAYHDTIATIKQSYSGTRIGASESIVSYLAEGTGLNLITPPGYLKAISEGTDPSAADRSEAEAQIAAGTIRVFVFNSQNSTPDVAALVAMARARGIKVTTVTETLAPAGASFQDWQTGQLKNLLTALAG